MCVRFNYTYSMLHCKCVCPHAVEKLVKCQTKYMYGFVYVSQVNKVLPGTPLKHFYFVIKPTHIFTDADSRLRIRSCSYYSDLCSFSGPLFLKSPIRVTVRAHKRHTTCSPPIIKHSYCNVTMRRPSPHRGQSLI